MAGDKLTPKLHLRQQGFTYNVCGPFTKHRESIQKFKETGDLNYIYKNELDKACFPHDAAYSGSQDLAKRTILDKILKDKAYEIAINSKYDGYQRGLANMVYKFFDKKTESRASVNEELAQELHKPVIKKFKRRRIYDARFKDNIWAVDLAEMRSLSSKNCGVKYLLRVINVFIKYASVKPLKDKKTKTVLNGFTEIVNESKRKPNKLWVDQEREIYNNNLMQK